MGTNCSSVGSEGKTLLRKNHSQEGWKKSWGLAFQHVPQFVGRFPSISINASAVQALTSPPVGPGCGCLRPLYWQMLTPLQYPESQLHDLLPLFLQREYSYRVDRNQGGKRCLPCARAALGPPVPATDIWQSPAQSVTWLVPKHDVTNVVQL